MIPRGDRISQTVIPRRGAAGDCERCINRRDELIRIRSFATALDGRRAICGVSIVEQSALPQPSIAETPRDLLCVREIEICPIDKRTLREFLARINESCSCGGRLLQHASYPVPELTTVV